MLFKIYLTFLFASILLPSTLSQFNFEQFLETWKRKCVKSDFQCGEHCISNKLVCDGNPDCADKSDEANCGMSLKACSDPAYIQCHDKKCVANSSACNGVEDCTGGEDEKNCHPRLVMPKCGGKLFQCKDGSCILPSWICDGTKDCKDGEDEIPGCEERVRCQDNEFRCKNHKCIPKVFVCDGINDCIDESDEKNCSSKTIDFTQCTSSNGKFACNDNSRCIDIQQTCNKIKDCSDGSDENPIFCESKELCKNCTHECVHTITGPVCRCKDGFMLESSNNSCVDLNECYLFGKCDQKCTNTIGSYNCSCDLPYVLQSDGHTCKVQSGEALLLYTATNKINEFFLSSNVSYTIVDKIPGVVGVATGGRYVYWSVFQNDNQAIMRAQSDGSEPEAIVTSGVDQVEGIAVDWITMNIYFTNLGKKNIGVCSKDGYTCIVLHNEDIDQLRAIALSPKHGLMFWTDWGKRPLIARSGMDGSNVIVLVGGNVFRPYGVTVDEPAERVYWIEAKLKQIQTIKFDTTDRRIILGNIALHPFSIAIFENQMFWSDSRGREILACNKFSGRNRRSVLRDPVSHIHGIYIHHHLLQSRTNVTNPCNGAPCTDLCLLKPSSLGLSYKCACPEGKTLSLNGFTCHSVGSPRVLVATTLNHLVVIEYRTLGRPRITDNNLLTVGVITASTYDSKRNRIIMFDSTSRLLLSYNLQKTESEILYSSGLGELNSLHYDEIGDNLYWCDLYTMNIEVLNLNTLSRMVIISRSRVETPYDLALAPELDYLFISLIISYHHVEIYRYSMSGSVVSKMLLVDLGLNNLEVKMHYSKELQRLFFTNGPSGRIESIDVNGENRQIFLENQGLISLTSSNGILFWAERWSPYVFSKGPSDTQVERNIKLSDVFASGATVTVTPLSKWNASNSPCAVNNGGCSHLCLVSHQTTTKKICACPSGLALSIDDVTCMEAKSCSENEYQCLTGECISQKKVCNGHEDCVHGDDERSSICGAGLRCPAEQFLCANKMKCVDNSRRCDGNLDCSDGSDEICNRNCTKMHDKYWCFSGECIDIHFRCDSKVDCSGGYDELNCHSTNCSGNEFRCLSGQCIPLEWECDSEPDCVDGSDESPKCRGSRCYNGEFECNNKLCVDIRTTCNGIDDCGDNSDEVKCQYSQMARASHNFCSPRNEFFCPSNGRPCLPSTVRCNGTTECLDGSDEQNCTASSCIKGEEFYCVNSRKCISSQWVCDNYDDCGDNSDEAESACSVKSLPNNKCSGFKCGSGECVSLLKVCDKIPDCQDRSDEGKQCNVTCANFGCEYKCLQTPRGPQCLCQNGFSLDPKTNTTCVDVDECSQNMCSQQCENTNGSFKCSCYTSHYILRSDHISCKARGDSMIFVAASDISVDIFSNNLKHKIEMNLKTNVFRTIAGIDVDSFNRSIFILLSDDELRRVQIVESGGDDRMRLPGITSFTHDWITQNIYYVEEHIALKVTVWNSTQAIQIYHTNGTNYMWALAIDPFAGYIFWYECDSFLDNMISGKIKRADASGANPETIIENMAYGVTQLVVDSFGQHIYWINRLEHSIHRVNYDNTHGFTMTAIDDDAVAFTYFENHVYLVTRHLDNFGVKRCKIYGPPLRQCETVKTSLSYIQYLSIVQENRQKTIPNPCHGVLCSGVCVTSPVGLMCKHFDGSSSPIVESKALSWRQEDTGITFLTVLAYFIVISFAIGLAVAFYFYRYKPKSTFLQRFRFHNPIYSKGEYPDPTYGSEYTSILNADVTYDNPLIEDASEIMLRKKNTFLETPHEEANSVEFEVNTSHTVSAEPLIKI